MIRNPLLVAGFAAAMALGVTTAQAQTKTQPNAVGEATTAQKAGPADQKFLKEAIEGDLAEVQVGKLAQQKGGTQDVKQFGQTLEQDHSQNVQKAENLAQQMGVTAPTEPNAKQKAEYEKLQGLSGKQFDKQFKQAMVKDHKEDIAKFEKEAKKKGQLGNFAQQTIPVLKKHLKMAEDLGKNNATTGSK